MPRATHNPSRVLVIGAGPAGSLAAIRLARAGVRVTLVEQSRFPRDKVCGECLSAMGLATLRRAGMDAVLEPLGPARLTRTTLVSTTGRIATHELDHPMWGLTRRRMDAALLDEARRAGAEILQPARVERITTGADVAPTATFRLEDNTVLERGFDLVLVADGKSALLPGKPRPTGDLGVKAHFTGVLADAGSIHLFALAGEGTGARRTGSTSQMPIESSGHYGGLAAVEGGLWNVALSVPHAMARRFKGDLPALWDDLVRRHPFLRSSFECAARVGDFLASPLPRFPVRSDWPVGVIPLGNAAAALEPIGGEGMGLALRSAELATDEVLSAMKAGRAVSTAGLRDEYARLWRTRRPACRAVAIGISRPLLSRWMVPLSTRLRPVTGSVLRLMGKASLS